MQGGAPRHFVTATRQRLDQAFGEQPIGGGGAVSWPARSPDLNPLDVWLEEHLRLGVFSADQRLRGIRARLKNACQGILVTAGILDRVRTCVTHS
jgi:hypothetical protein